MDLSNEILAYLREKIEIKVKTKRDESFLTVRVELWLDNKLISFDEDSARVDY